MRNRLSRHRTHFSFLALGTMLAAGAACSAPVDNPPPPPGDVTEIAGTISGDTTIEGVINMTGDVMVPAGVTLTVAPGSWIGANEGTFLRVEGSLVIAGTEAEPVSAYPLGDAPSWGGITAEAGGSVDIAHLEGEHVSALLTCKTDAAHCAMDSVRYVYLGNAIVANAPATITNSYFEDMANAGISVRAGADLSITDTYILTSSHDLVVTQAGSRLTVDHSEIGGAQGSYEHCNFHIGGADYISITNTNMIASVYAIMIGNTSNAIIAGNNIMDNDNDILEVGTNSNVDLTNNYWSRGAPTLGAAYDTSQPVAEPFAEAGPRW